MFDIIVLVIGALLTIVFLDYAMGKQK